MISAIQSTAIQIDDNEQDLHFYNAPSTQPSQLLVNSSVLSPPDYQTSKFHSNIGEISSQSSRVSLSSKPLIKSVNIDNFLNLETTPTAVIKSQDSGTPRQDTQNPCVADNIELDSFTDKSKFSKSDWHNKEFFLINGPYRKTKDQTDDKRQNPQTTRVKLQFWPNNYETHLREGLLFEDLKDDKTPNKVDRVEKVLNRDDDSDSGRNLSSGSDELEDEETVKHSELRDAKWKNSQASKNQEIAAELSMKQKMLNFRPVFTQKFESVQAYLKNGKNQFHIPFNNDKYICTPNLPAKPKSSTYYIAWNECKLITDDTEKLNNQQSTKSKLGELSEEIAKEHIDRQLKTELGSDLDRTEEQTPIHQTSTVQYDALENRPSSRINSSKFSTSNLQSENSQFTDVTYFNEKIMTINNNENNGGDNISEKSQSSQKTEASHKSQNSGRSQARSQAHSQAHSQASNTSHETKTLQNSQSSNRQPKVVDNEEFDQNFNPSAMPEPQVDEPVEPKLPMIEIKLSPARLEFYEKEKSAKVVSQECTLESAANNNVKEFIDFTRIWHVYKRDNNEYVKVKEPKDGVFQRCKKTIKESWDESSRKGFAKNTKKLDKKLKTDSSESEIEKAKELEKSEEKSGESQRTPKKVNISLKKSSKPLSFLCGLGIREPRKMKSNEKPKKKLVKPDLTKDPKTKELKNQKSANRNNSVSSTSSESAQSSISPERSEKDSGIHDPDNIDSQDQLQSLPPSAQKCNQYKALPCKEAAFTIEVFSDEGFYSLAFVDSITRNNWFEMIESKLNDVRQEKTFNFYEMKESKKQQAKFTLPGHIATRPNYNYHAIYKVNINDFEHAFTEIARGNQTASRILPSDLFKEKYGFEKHCGSDNHGRFCDKRIWKTYEGVYWVALESKNLHIINPRYNGQTVKFTGNDKNLNFVESDMSESICAIIPFDYGICVSRCGRNAKRPYLVLNYKISTPYEHMKTKMFFPSPGCMDNPDVATCTENDTTYLRMRLFTDTWDQMLNFHFDLLEWKNRQVASAQVTLEPSMGKKVKEQYHIDLYKNDGQFRHEYKARKAKKINYVELPEETKKNLKHYRNDNAYIINRHTSSPEIFPGDHGKEYKSRSKGAKAMRVKAWNRREFDDLTAADLSAYMLTDFSAIENPQAKTALKKICLLERRAEIEEFWRKEKSVYEPCDLLNFVKQIPGEAAEEQTRLMQEEINRANSAAQGIKTGSLVDDTEPSNSTKPSKTQLIKPNADTQDYIRASGLRKCLKIQKPSMKPVSATPSASLTDLKAHSRTPSHNSSVFISNKASNHVTTSVLNDDEVPLRHVSGHIYENIVINDTPVHSQNTCQEKNSETGSHHSFRNDNQQTNEDATCLTMTTNMTTVESTSSITTPIPVANVKSFNFIIDENQKVETHNANSSHVDFNQNNCLELDSGEKSDQFKSGDYIVSGMMH